MTLANFRREPIRSRKLLDSAKGQPCTLEFVGVCNHNPETTVSCHITDESFGMGMKADDSSTVHGCSACHMFLDHGWAGRITETERLQHILRAILRTTRNRIDRGLMVVSQDAPGGRVGKSSVRKSPEQRRKIQNNAPMPGSKASGIKRRLDGVTIDRATGEVL